MDKDNKSSAADAGNEFEEMIKDAASNNGKQQNVADAEDTETPENTDEAAQDEAVSAGDVVESTAETVTSDQADDNSEMEAMKAEAKKNLEGWQRTLAEFQNYKRRMEREQSESRLRITLDTLTQIIPIIDDFERAMDNVPEELREDPWVNGTMMIGKKFQKVLEENDVEIIDPVGELFDPNRHEAVGMEDSDEIESGHVTMTLQKGYASGDRVLRPAIVRVAS